jgi:hypothetical protein
MMDVIIVDDEAAGRRTLREYCEAEPRPRWPRFEYRNRNYYFSIYRWTR